MKSKLYIAALISISLLNHSCSKDDSYEIQGIKKNNFKTKKQLDFNNELNEKTVDSSAVIHESNTVEGDPSNPKPPRG